MKHIILTLVLAISSSWAVAQTSDSTSVTLPMPLLPNVTSSEKGSTIANLVKTGTMCGSFANVGQLGSSGQTMITYCGGHNPYVSCPVGYVKHEVWMGVRDDTSATSFYTCIKT